MINTSKELINQQCFVSAQAGEFLQDVHQVGGRKKPVQGKYRMNKEYLQFIGVCWKKKGLWLPLLIIVIHFLGRFLWEGSPSA